MNACSTCLCTPCKQTERCRERERECAEQKVAAFCPHGHDLHSPPWHSDHPDWGVCSLCYRERSPSPAQVRAAAIDVALLRALASTLEAQGRPLSDSPGFDRQAVRNRLILLVDFT